MFIYNIISGLSEMLLTCNWGSTVILRPCKHKFVFVLVNLYIWLSIGVVQVTNALHAQTKIVENTTLMKTQTCTCQHIFDQHKSQSHHGLLKLHLVSKKLCKRKTKSLSEWKLKCTSSEKLTIPWETHTKALQVIKHMVWSQWTLRRAHSMLVVL